MDEPIYIDLSLCHEGQKVTNFKDSLLYFSLFSMLLAVSLLKSDFINPSELCRRCLKM